MDDLESRPIVVGVDGSSAGRAALAWAVDEAARPWTDDRVTP